MRLEEISHEADDNVGADENEDNACSHCKCGADGCGYGKSRAHSEEQNEDGVFFPDACEESAA